MNLLGSYNLMRWVWAHTAFCIEEGADSNRTWPSFAPKERETLKPIVLEAVNPNRIVLLQGIQLGRFLENGASYSASGEPDQGLLVTRRYLFGV